ncbi:hypothetical protein H2200_001791 [Cladophialophora chaetospira]|uniref:Uncharacterized protein n=1 Tax=Cladophialophora chaetospira TaxID=386627 RepID=A0AA39CPE7_9EURO|nr:hypothetical protein H2200_001791 [Cladophialophora chaetospira]
MAVTSGSRYNDLKASRIQQLPFAPTSSNHVGHSNKTHKVASDQNRRRKRGRNAAVEAEAFSREDDLTDQALTRKATHNLKPHKDSTEDPGEKYARRPRNKTKEDRYDYKDVPEKHSKKRHSKNSVKKKAGAILNEEFQAPNVATERLTLRSTGPGFLSKGKASATTEWRDLPDLTFSEMRFLKREREDDNARFKQIRDSHPKKKSSKGPNQEISEFFSRPDIGKDESTSVRKTPSMASYVSWSISPPRRSAASTARRPNFAAHSDQRERRQVDVHNDLSIHTSIGPDSSVSNRFLRDLTTSALLRGVDTFAPGERRYYSLEDLRVLAERVTAPSSRKEEAPDESSILRIARRPTNPLERPSDDTMWRRDEVGAMPAVDPVDLTSSLADEKTYPATQMQQPTYTADYKPQQDPLDHPAWHTSREIGVDNTHISKQEGLLVPEQMRSAVSRKNELENELDLLPFYTYTPLSPVDRLNNHSQFIEECDQADTISVPRVRRRIDFMDGRDPAGNMDERRVQNNIEDVQFGLPLAAELSRTDHRMQEPNAIRAFTPTSDVLDEFDESLLRDMVEDFKPGEAITQSDDPTYGNDQDEVSRNPNSQILHLGSTIDDYDQPVYGLVEIKARSGTMVDNDTPNPSRFPETAHHVVDDSRSIFNGFSQGQILY